MSTYDPADASVRAASTYPYLSAADVTQRKRLRDWGISREELSVVLDEVEQVVKLLASVRMVWTDENMIWDPEEYDDIDYVTVTRDDVWLPDIELQENIDKDFISTANTYIEVTNNGKMNWYFPALLTSTCPIDITYFPFDTQVCHMTFVPWTLDNTLVQLNRSHDQDSTFDRYNRNGVWLLAHTVEDVTESASGKTWSEVRVNLRFRREPGFFFKTIILPSCLLTLLMSLVCWLHPASGEKVTLAVNNLVAMILFQQLVADRIPPSGNSTSIIVNLFLLLIILCCFEVACAVIVLRLYHTGNRKEFPEWMRKLMTSRLITPLVSDHARHLFILTSHDEKQSENHMADQTGDATSESRQHHEFCVTLLKGHQESNREAAQKMSVQPVNGQLAEGVVQQLCDPQGTEVQWREAAIVLDRVLFVVIFILTLATWLYVLISFIFRTDNKT